MFLEVWNRLNSFEFAKPDPFTSKLPLVGTPWQAFLVNIAYLVIVLKLGPALMRNRPAYKLKNTLLIYNAVQVLINLSIPIIAYILVVYYHAINIGCIVGLPIDHPLKWMEVACFYLYYLDKYIDFLDTIFFVLRKSTRQITFLHVYHHIMMAISSYVYMRYFGIGGHIASTGVLNAIIHTIMYSYYFISAWNPSLKNSMWWKKYITILQIVQFVVLTLHHLYPILFVPNCKSPMIVQYFSVLQGIIMLIMFTKFYNKAYMNRSAKDCNKIGKSN